MQSVWTHQDQGEFWYLAGSLEEQRAHLSGQTSSDNSQIPVDTTS